ncbi:MAG TPA: VanZ family protein [Myxococcota bacterium]|nr:VanZ family protein [Myxococcota bacterium]
MIKILPGRAAVALLYMSGVISLSALPGRTVAKWGFTRFQLDLLHIPLFTGLALVTLWAVVASRWTRALLVFVALAAFAAGDEILQLWVPGREASFADFARDALGVGIGIVIWEAARPLALSLRREWER